jgi:hypothetical protein
LMIALMSFIPRGSCLECLEPQMHVLCRTESERRVAMRSLTVHQFSASARRERARLVRQSRLLWKRRVTTVNATAVKASSL